jgi:gas vesicle protein
MVSRTDMDFLREREDVATTRGFFGGVLLGALLGIVLTLVFAPRRGDETRAVLATAAGDVAHKAVDLAHHANPFSDGNGQPDGAEYSGKAAIEREIVEEEVA